MKVTPPDGFERFPIAGKFSQHMGGLFRKGQGAETIWGFVAEDIHENPNGVIHGGALMSFIDTVMGQTVEETAGRYTATISLTVEFVAGAKVPCWVEGRVGITRLARTLAFARAEVTSGAATLLTATGIWRVFDQESARVKALHGSSP